MAAAAGNAQLVRDAERMTTGATVHRASNTMMLYKDACRRRNRRDIARYEGELRHLVYQLPISEACAIVTLRRGRRASK